MILLTCQELQSSLLNKILKEPRFFAEYFRVGFYGKGFDRNISVIDFHDLVLNVNRESNSSIVV